MPNTSDVFSVSHATDLDGVASAALLASKYNIDEKHIFFADHSAELFDYVIEKLSSIRQCSTLFITDISVNKAEVDKWYGLLSRLKGIGCKIVWLDHHSWPKEADKIAKLCDIAIFGENKSMCATDIVARETGLESKYREIVKATHMSDFALVPKDKKEASIIRQYDLAISYYNTFSISKMQSKMRALAKALAKGKFENTQVAKDAKAFDKISRRNIEKMLSGAVEIKDIAIGFSSDKACYDDALEALRNKSGKDIVILVDYDKNTASMRAQHKNIMPLALALGGGGHPHAAGFSIKGINLKSKKGREQIINKIISKAKEVKIIK